MIRRIAIPSRSRSSFISSRICACTVTSSAVVGSSAIRSFGSEESAIAIITRWRMPPDIWCGWSLTRRSAEGIPTSCISSTARTRASFRPSPWWSRTASAIWLPTVKTGFREVIGSWKIIEMSLPRIFASSFSSSLARSRPSKTIFESGEIRPGASTSRITESAVTDLPLPDSPTTASVPPCAISKSIPSTARSMPFCVANHVLRFSTFSSGVTTCPSRCRTRPGTGTAMCRSSCASAISGSRVCRAESRARCSATVSSKLRERS